MARHASVNRASIHPFLVGAFVRPDSLVAVFLPVSARRCKPKNNRLFDDLDE
jgi:hypothetical protein